MQSTVTVLPTSNTANSQGQTRKPFPNDDTILAELLDRADDWAWETCIAYGGKPHTPLVLNNEWQNCGYKQSYIGNYGFYPDGKPYVYVTYNHFKYGSVKFQYKKVYAETITSYKAGKTYTPKTRKVTQENQTGKEVTLKQTLKEDMLKQLLIFDQELWNDGVDNLPYLHDYWKHKGFVENVVDPSIRYVCIEANKFNAFPQIAIMAKVIGTDGKLKGFQKIFDGGRKELTQAMSKKGNFIALGTEGVLLEKLKEVFTTEGLATGATVRQALDNKIPVIVTIDAGNIEPVISAIRTKYGTKSKCSITIVADDDKWVALELDPITNKPKPNAGLTKSHPTALRHRCKIVSPNFEGLDTSRLPTDFDDLRQLASLDEVKRQLSLAKKPNLHIAITQESLDQERKRIWQNFFGHKVISINERYLTDDVADDDEGNVRTLKELILAHKTSLLRCPINTGKTTAIAKIVKALTGCSVLYITYLTSLNKKASNDLGLEDYTEYQGYNNPEYAKLTELQKLSICLNSLFKLLDKNGKLVRNIDIVIIDEIQQVIRRLTSKIKNKVQVLSALKQLVQGAKHLVLMDAHIDTVTLDFLRQCLPKERFFALLNEYQVGKGRDILLYDHEGMIIDKAIEALNNGQRAFIVTNNMKWAWEVFYKLEEATGKRGLPITSLNSGDKKVEKFFSDVNREVLNYDFIVCSPSVTSGISIDEDVFGFVGGNFTHTVNTPMDCLQALGRVRKANTFHVYVSDVKQVLPTTDEDISAKWTHTHKYDKTLLSFDDLSNDELLDVAQDYKKICVSATKEANFAMQDFLTRFAKLCLLDGYNIRYTDATDEDLQQAKFLQTDSKDLEDIKFIKGRATAKTPSDEEHEKLKGKPRKTLEETCQTDKKEIVDFYVLDETTPQEIVEQVITEDRRGKTRKEIINLEIALSTDNQIQEMRKEEAKAGTMFDRDKRAFATEREAYRKIFAAADINTELITDQTTYSAETLLTTFVPWILQNYLVLKGIFPRLAKPEQIERDPIRTFGTLLKRLGLSQRKIGKNENAEYQVNTLRLEHVRKILIRRGRLRKEGTHNVYNNIITSSIPTVQKPSTEGVG